MRASSANAKTSKKATRWDTLIEDKTPKMSVWVNELEKITDKGVNRYPGLAPGSIKKFDDLWNGV
jgi:hypothetical protein